MTKFRLANPCHKESKQKKPDKRDKINANECLVNTTLCSKTWQTLLNPSNLIQRKSILTSPFEMVRVQPCVANTSCKTGFNKKRIN